MSKIQWAEENAAEGSRTREDEDGKVVRIPKAHQTHNAICDHDKRRNIMGKKHNGKYGKDKGHEIMKQLK